MGFLSGGGLGNAGFAIRTNGLRFPATAIASSDPNTLDEYEEGTWTPFWGGSANPTVTYADQDGLYTRIGDVVILQCRIATNAVSGGSGNLILRGIPFASVSGYACGAMATIVGLNIARCFIAPHYGSSTAIGFYKSDGNLAQVSDLPASSFTDLTLEITYKGA